jgi:PKD repeat protein
MNMQKGLYNQVIFTITMVFVGCCLQSSGLWAVEQIDFYPANSSGFIQVTPGDVGGIPASLNTKGALIQMHDLYKGKDTGAVLHASNEQYGTFPPGEGEADTPDTAKIDFIASETTLCEEGYVTFTIRYSGSIWSILWIFEGGIPHTSTAQNPTVYYSTPGTYDVTLIVTNQGGTYTITKYGYITVLPADEIAEAVDYADVCQVFIKSGDADWYREINIYKYDNDSARSGDIDDDQSSTIETTITFTSGVVKFYWKVSSEANYDYLRFYVDDVEKTRISGAVNWTQVSYNIDAGTHTLKWSYTKDGSVSSGSDCGWLDKLETQ